MYDLGMASTAQQLQGIEAALNRLEMRIKRYREVLFSMMCGMPMNPPMEEVAVTEGEVQFVEKLVEALAIRISGSSAPDKTIWEPMVSYCRRTKSTFPTWAQDNHEY